MGNIFYRFLKTLDFTYNELDILTEDFQFAINKIGLTEDDIKYAMNIWIPANWDITLKGVRMCIGAYIREFIQINKIKEYRAKGVKIVYGISPSHSSLFRAIKLSDENNIFVSYPDFLYSIVIGGFFNRIDLLNNNDDRLSVRCRHCTLNRIRIDSSIKEIIPKPDIIWSWGFYCDEAPKTEELINIMLGNNWNYIISRMPHDVPNGNEEDKNKDRVEYLAEQFRDAHREISKITGIEVNNKNMYDALIENSKYTKKLDELTRLVCNTDPQPMGGNELALFGTTNSMTFNTGYIFFEKALDTILEEIKLKISQKIGILPVGSPKLGCHFTPICVPWVERTFLENGVSISFSSNLSFSKINFQPFDYYDPYKMAAQVWLRIASSVNSGYQIKLISEMIKEYDIDGMLYGFFTFDRWLGSNQNMILKRIEKETGVHHFYIEGDFWDDTNFKKAERKGRIESISYFLKTRKLMTSKVYAESMKKQEKDKWQETKH